MTPVVSLVVVRASYFPDETRRAAFETKPKGCEANVSSAWLLDDANDTWSGREDTRGECENAKKAGRVLINEPKRSAKLTGEGSFGKRPTVGQPSALSVLTFIAPPILPPILPPLDNYP
ncbi:hypothetical protein K0M31_013338 [Melipona bicolor]|uniref:Uncharacterized protein n=1 Tax=Melipona bicolor TaxID=60889 RepID=A0AA40KGN5_9HYME|nr:hypothetical protein K0M31_013338 [Melipona bicolor]